MAQTAPTKRPRHYAAEIVALPTREARRDALAAVPDPLRQWVQELVEDHFARRAHRRNPTQVPASTPPSAQPAAPSVKSRPAVGSSALAQMRGALS